MRVGDGVVRARTRSGLVPGPGTPVWLSADPARVHFFHSGTGESLGVRV